MKTRMALSALATGAFLSIAPMAFAGTTPTAKAATTMTAKRQGTPAPAAKKGTPKKVRKHIRRHRAAVKKDAK